MESYVYEAIEHGERCPVNVFITSIEISRFHWHYDYELMLVLKGSVAVNTLPAPFVLKAGQIYLFNSTQVHELRKTEEDNICLFIQITSALFRGKSEGNRRFQFYLNSQSESNMPAIGYRPFIRQAAAIGLLSTSTNPNPNPYRLQSKLYGLLADLFEFGVYDIHQSAAGRDLQQDATTLLNIIDYIRENSQEETVLEQLYKHFGMSEKTVYRFLKDNIGLSARELLLECRLEKAKYLLQFTDKPISFVVDVSGVGGENTFYRVFKKSTGLTPLEYRKRGGPTSGRSEIKGYLQYSTSEAVMLLKKLCAEDNNDEMHQRTASCQHPAGQTDCESDDLGRKSLSDVGQPGLSGTL